MVSERFFSRILCKISVNSTGLPLECCGLTQLSASVEISRENRDGPMLHSG